MPNSLQSAIVRIKTADNVIVGAGFLVTKHHIVTCAHIVRDALGRPSSNNEKPSEIVWVDFPYLSNENQRTTVEHWIPPREEGRSGDIAGLKLLDPLPSDAKPIRVNANINNRWDHKVRITGFPIRFYASETPSGKRETGYAAYDEAVSLQGVLRDTTIYGRWQIQVEDNAGFQIEKGFSGSPVWDVTDGVVLGMVATQDPDNKTRTGFAVSVKSILDSWPELHRTLLERENPYRGLSAFQVKDAGVFFGREVVAGELATAVAHKPFVAVIGASGSGKSSVVFAGLLPKVGQETAVVSFRPGSQPFRALADALLPIWQPELLGNERLEEAGNLAANLQAGKTQLLEVVNDILQRQPMWKRLLLVADQFEELYTLCPQPEVKRAFVRCLVTAVQAQAGQHSPTFTLLLTMRADFMGQATEERPLADALQNATYILGPMTREELAAAIENPAQVASVQFEPGLVARILDDVGDEPGNLPLLEFALTLLWEQQSNGLLTHAAYEAIGEVEGALAQYAEDQFGGLSQPEQEQARFIFTQLVQPGRGTEDTRRQATLSNIGMENWGLVKWLADARLVVTNQNEAGEETAEVVHEVLTRRWQRLREWVNEDRRFREWQERLREAMRQWGAAKEDEAALLRGALLAEAESWLAEQSGQLPAKERAFIEKSIEFSEHTRLAEIRRRNVVLAVSLLATVLFAVLGLFSYGQSQDLAVEGTRAAANEGTAVANALRANAESTRAISNQGTAIANAVLANIESTRAADNETLALTERDRAELKAQEAFSRQLAAQAIKQLDESYFELGLLLSIESARAAQTSEAFASIREAISFPAKLKFSLSGTGFDTQTVWSTDESLILQVEKTDGNVKGIDPGTGKELFAYKILHSDAINYVALNKRGDLLLTASEDGTSKVWNFTTGQEVLSLRHNGPVYQAVWNNTDSLILTASADGTVRVWDAETGSEQLVLSHSEPVHEAFWNSSETEILSDCCDGGATVWDAVTGEKRLVLTSGRSLRKVAWNANSSCILTLEDGGLMARVWDATTGEEIFALKDSIDASWNADGSLIATQHSHQMTIWDATNGSEMFTFYSEEFISQTVWDQTGTLVILVTERGTGQVYNAKTGQRIFTIRPIGKVINWSKNNASILTSSGLWSLSQGYEYRTFVHNNTITKVVISHDASKLLTLSTDGIARIWDINTGMQILAYSHGESVHDAAWNQSGTLVFTVGQSFVKIWDANDGHEVSSLMHDQTIGQIRSLVLGQVTWSPDGNHLLTSSQEWNGHYSGIVKVWDVNTSEVVLTIAREGEINSVTWSSDGSKVMTAGADGSVVVWDVATGKARLSLNHADNVSSAIWNEDESLILTVEDSTNKNAAAYSSDYYDGGQVTVWNAITGERLLTIKYDGGWFWAAKWNKSENGILTYSTDNKVHIWNSENGDPLLEIANSNLLTDAKFNRDESLILVSSSDRASLWNALTGEKYFDLIHRLRSFSFLQASWINDEKFILTWDAHSIGVWHALTGQEHFLINQETPIKQVIWNENQDVIIVVTENQVSLLLIEMDRLIEAACQQAVRNLSIDEWQQFMNDLQYHVTCPGLPSSS